MPKVGRKAKGKMTLKVKYTKKNGEVKYYATYQSAWNAAAKLNETTSNGLWFFEMDLNGWFLYFAADEVVA